MKYLITLSILFLFIIGCSKEPDVITTDSGLMYAEDTLGTGDAAKSGDMVVIHFYAYMANDSANLFGNWQDDTTYQKMSLGSSFQYGEPLKFTLGKDTPIAGIEEGIVGMKEGGTRTLIIPSENAYGDAQYGPIPPNTDLKIVAMLLEVKEPVVAEMWDVDTTRANTTASGLKYVIVEEGSGEQADPGDTVTVHYTGWLKDGNKFDSSVERDEPYTFVLGQGMVIKGWDEGVGLLKVGDKARLIVPPGLAYGERSLGMIPPNATLIFDVELIDVK